MTDDELIDEALERSQAHWSGLALRTCTTMAGWRAGDDRIPAFTKTAEEYEQRALRFAALRARRRSAT